MDGLFICKDNKYLDQVKGTSILSLLARKDDLEIMLYEFQAERPNSITPGDNAELMEFYYILGGAIIVQDGNNSVTLQKGDYLC